MKYGRLNERDRSCCTRARRSRASFIIIVVLFALLIVSIFLIAMVAGPLHAGCKIEYNLDESCSTAFTKIKTQFNLWSHTNCGSGQKCRYQLFDSDEFKVITGTHTTPVKKYVDSLQFHFDSSSPQECKILAESRSDVFYAVLDYGTNYCNLHNLVEGAGLIQPSKLSKQEITSDSQCTQYSSANCDKF